MSRIFSRREFLDRGSALALGLGALYAGLDAHTLVPTLGRSSSDAPLEARASVAAADAFTLGNEAIAATWSVADGAFRPVALHDRLNGAALPLSAEAFTLTLADRSTIAASAMRITAPPRMERLTADPRAARAAARLPGRAIALTLRDAAGRVEIRWRGILRDGARYLRQEIVLRPLGDAVPVREITLLDFHAREAMVTGTVAGSPLVAGRAYFAVEHPLADNGLDADHVQGRMRRTLPLRPGTTLVVSSVAGVTAPGQLRRDFLAYVERERAHPYRTFLHYNSWYDLGFFNRYDEAGALAVIAAMGTELHEKRGTVLDSFLFDDGWDDPKTLWRFDAGFPDGFTRVEAATHRYGAAPGVWMSPWGGYGKPREERLAYGKAHGFETNADGLALSGPRYYARFRGTCLDMIHRYGVNQFKFDGTGNSSVSTPGSAFDSDFDAAIHLIGDLRAAEPDLLVNLTTGTYPSPFWLRYADSIWRGGDDTAFAGIGSSRQRWITYRDADSYEHVVRAGALYPLNSLMLHGLVYARFAHDLDTDPGHDFASEIHSYFGTGTQLQEMYVTPSLLAPGDWDTLAESARWSRANAGTLVDTHWVGGDPLRLEPYGWASWSPAKGIITLRNPSDAPQRIDVDIADAFELPAGAPRVYSARSPWRADRGRAPVTLSAGEAHRFHLRPFEVITLDATPRS